MDIEIKCPSCGNEKDNYFVDMGENSILYYQCRCCNLGFFVDVSHYINELEISAYESATSE
jgi:transcription elongation factor Elf1